MGRIKDLIIDCEMMNELGIELTCDDIISIMETENLSIDEFIFELKNNIN